MPAALKLYITLHYITNFNVHGYMYAAVRSRCLLPAACCSWIAVLLPLPRLQPARLYSLFKVFSVAPLSVLFHLLARGL